MKLKDLKEAVTELINEVSLQGLHNVADALGDTHYNDNFFVDLSPIEKKVIIGLAQVGTDPKAQNISFEKLTRIVADKVGAVVHPQWPKYEAFAEGADGDVKFDPVEAKHYICGVIQKGGDGDRIRNVKQGECPAIWGISKNKMNKSNLNWWSGLDKSEKKVLNRVEAKVLNDEYEPDTDFATAVEDAAGELGVNVRSLAFMDSALSIRQAKTELGKKLAAAGEKPLAEAKSDKKKKGFGEGDPPDEEIYKKREVVQEIDAETPEAAQALGDASKEQGEAAKGVADAHTRAAQAAKQRQDASKAWKDAKITQVKAIDAAEKAAAEEAKATDAQSKAMDAAQKATDAAEKAQGEKEKYLDVAKQAAEAEKEAASAAEEAAKAEEEAENELSDSNTAAADADQQRSEKETDFGDAVSSDEEERAKEDEEAKKAEEEAKKADEEREKKEKEADRKAADKEAQDKADSEKDSKESEEEPMTEMIKNMVRQVMSERKWGEAKDSQPVPPVEKLKQAGITAQDLKGMVLNTVMAGEEERDMEMIKLLKSMLDSLQSIEYHSTPAKGASSQLAQAVGKGWVNEGKNNQIFINIPSLISEMRDNGLEREADDHESFFKWALANSDLTMQEIKNEADAQIADLKKMLRKMSDHVTGKEDSLEKQKLRGEVPGHH